MSFTLSSSVGKNGVNHPEDVAVVRARLVALGFDWIVGATNAGPAFIAAIELFQSIKAGRDVGLCTPLAGHDDQIHVEIRPPARIDG